MQKQCEQSFIAKGFRVFGEAICVHAIRGNNFEPTIRLEEKTTVVDDSVAAAAAQYRRYYQRHTETTNNMITS